MSSLPACAWPVIDLAFVMLGQSGAGGPAQPGTGSGGDGAKFIIWAVLLIGAAIALFIVELFIPSGGIIGLVGAIGLVGGIVLLFLNNATLGLIGAAVTLLALPFVIGFALKIWPETPIGKLFILDQGSSKPAGGGTSRGGGPGGDPSDLSNEQAQGEETALAPGTEGKALTDLHPVGTCLIHGQREQCLASGGQIDAGQPIRVVAVDGTQIKVQARRR